MPILVLRVGRLLAQSAQHVLYAPEQQADLVHALQHVLELAVPREVHASDGGAELLAVEGRGALSGVLGQELARDGLEVAPPVDAVQQQL